MNSEMAYCLARGEMTTEKKITVPDRNRSCDLYNAGRMLYLFNDKNSRLPSNASG